MRIRASNLIPLVVLLSCSDPVSPEQITGEYELVIFRGAQVPATVTDGDSTVSVSSGQVYLLDHGISSHRRTYQLDATTELLQVRTLGYELNGNQVQWFELPCPPGQTCASLPLPAPLTLSGNRLVSSAELGEEYVRRGDIP